MEIEEYPVITTSETEASAWGFELFPSPGDLTERNKKITLGGDKGYDARDYVSAVRELGVTASREPP